ncbi:TRIM2_3 [Mytilus coruscus]|uniref:TRIM2_3 n=1 Tax=Mytilus coruscus TaxID=42192 RepID=A0A6J8AEV7_MYTCO|nr:TRIM2_3 [Mytilus coruscus]
MVDVTQDCAICLEKLKAPKILPCSHLFCEVCFSEYIISTVNKPEQKTYNCPVCRIDIEINNPTSHNSTWGPSLPSAKCCDLHRRFRTTTTHKTMPITTPSNDDFKFLIETNEFCSLHETKSLDVYCLDHAVPCCVVCLAVNHRTCKVKCIEELDDVKVENIERFQIELEDIKCSLNKLMNLKSNTKESLKASFQTMQKEAISTTANLKKRIDDLCQEFIKNSSLMQEDLQTELDNVIKQAQGYTSVLDTSILRLKTVNSFGSRSQLLIAKEKIKLEFAKKKSKIKSLLNQNQDINVSTDFQEILEALSKVDMLGNISVSKHTNEMPDKCNDQWHSLFESNHVQLETLTLKFRSILEHKERDFMCGVSLTSEKCVLISSIGQCEIINIRSNQIISSVSIRKAGKPKRICYDKSRERVTFHSNYGVCCEIKEDSIKQVRSQSFKDYVCGIDMFDEKLYILSDGVLQTPDMQNPSVFMQSYACGSVDDLAVDKESGRLAVTLQSSRSVSFTTFQERKLKNTVNFKVTPVAMAFGPDGILFVAESNCCISVISKNEKNLLPLIGKLDKLEKIRDIWTHNESNSLFVCGTNYVEKYDLQW